MKRLLSVAALGAISVAAPAIAETYYFDPTHTEVRFYYDHAGLSEQSGQWTVIDGSVEFDPENVEATQVTVSVEAASIQTGVEALDQHLQSGDFFDVGSYPTITFVSTGVTQVGDEAVTVVGDLTVKDTVQEISMTFSLNHIGPNPLGQFMEYFEGDWLGVSGTGEVLRSDFGVDMFAPIISDEIRLEISAEMRAGGWE